MYVALTRARGDFISPLPRAGCCMDRCAMASRPASCARFLRISCVGSIQESGFRSQDSGVRGQGQDSGIRIQESGFRSQDAGFRVECAARGVPSSQTQRSILDPQSSLAWRVGQSVVHPKFGAGVIVGAEGRVPRRACRSTFARRV